MNSFVVLGLVPGTDIQITFLWWLIAAATIVGALVGVRIVRRKIIARARLLWAILSLPYRSPQLSAVQTTPSIWS